jgi:uncharacterized membrane protein YwaF
MGKEYLKKEIKIPLLVFLIVLPILITFISINLGLVESYAYGALVITIPATIFALWIYNWTGNVCASYSSKKNPKTGYFVGLLVPYFIHLFTNIFIGLLASVILTWLYKRSNKK